MESRTGEARRSRAEEDPAVRQRRGELWAHRSELGTQESRMGRGSVCTLRACLYTQVPEPGVSPELAGTLPRSLGPGLLLRPSRLSLPHSHAP